MGGYVDFSFPAINLFTERDSQMSKNTVDM